MVEEYPDKSLEYFKFDLWSYVSFVDGRSYITGTYGKTIENVFVYICKKRTLLDFVDNIEETKNMMFFQCLPYLERCHGEMNREQEIEFDGIRIPIGVAEKFELYPLKANLRRL